MAYSDVSVSDALWSTNEIILNTTIWAVGLASERLGDPEGRAIQATATVYAAILTQILGFLVIGRVTSVTLCCLISAFGRWFSWASVTPVPHPKLHAARPARSPRPPRSPERSIWGRRPTPGPQPAATCPSGYWAGSSANLIAFGF